MSASYTRVYFCIFRLIVTCVFISCLLGVPNKGRMLMS